MTHSMKTFREMNLVEVVSAAQSGDRQAFGELVERYQRAVLAVGLRRLGNEAEAEELAQDVFVQALTRLHQLRDPARFGGWIRSIANRMAINRAVRTRPHITAEAALLDARVVELRTPQDEAIWNEHQEQVRAGLGRLREMDRETLVAFYVRGRSLREMSDDFDSPIGTIKRRLHVARKRLARELDETIAV